MTNIQQQILKEAKRHLIALYDKYKGLGIHAIYVWGSLTRNDFDPKTSDIDVICIVDDEFDKTNNEKVRDELTRYAPEYDWGFQIIYLDELNGGPIRSRLAQAMSPQSILPSFPSWIHVSGKHYGRTDFSVKDASIPERMVLNIQEIRTRLKNIPDDSTERKIRDRKGIVKACLLLIYNRQLLRNDYFDLDYNVLPGKADDAEELILTDLLDIKQLQKYSETGFTPYIPKIINFANKVEQEFIQAKQPTR
jgi:predicted nucleotidyltransferase